MLMHEVTRKVRTEHLRRRAYLYVRQSTLRQVIENTESTTRQYDLRQRAVALGWPEEQVVVIDKDLGLSGASAVDREGFQHLVSEVGLGRAGIVMGLEVSRLARRSSDWHRLVEICALSRTLILDEDGLYEPREFNDRLLLGLKGTMSEAELHFLRARLNGGRMNKLRRGELVFRLPTGFVHDARRRVVLDPDRQVQQAIRLFFETYGRVGTAHGVVRSFRNQGLRFPTRAHYGPHKGELVWAPLTCTRATGILHSPCYAGAYAYGRRQQQVGVDGRVAISYKPRESWHILIRDAHPGYITWAEYEENLARLEENARAAARTIRYAPGEGPALLQGLVLCGRCGARMTVRYRGRGEKIRPEYVCSGVGNTQAWPHCQSVPGASIDAAIGELLVEAMTPAALEVALSVQTELQSRVDEASALRHRQVERARYEADVARRRFMQVDPENRLVADELEADWNNKLRSLEAAREEYERRRGADRLVLDEVSKRRVCGLANDFPRVWRHPKTTDRDRKRMVRLLLEDVTLNKNEAIHVDVRFRGGASRSLLLPRPRASWQLRQLPRETVAEIDRLLEDHTDGEVADVLNERGIVSGTGRRFSGRRVRVIRRAYELRSRKARLRARGLLTLDEIAARLGVCKDTIKLWRRQGRVPVRCYRADDNDRYMYEDPASAR
jgi:DNA invertase Pin-like site-specific DNA recombinase